MRVIYITLVAISLAVITAFPATADNGKSDSTMDAAELSRLTQIMKDNPKDLDSFFKYAQLSTQLGRLKSAENAYKHMLEVNPKLDNIRVALALIFIKTSNNKQATKLLNEVLESNPPEKIKNEINEIIKKLTLQSTTDISSAQNSDDSQKQKAKVQKKLKSDSETKDEMSRALAELKIKITKEPNNLDNFFSYAKLAEKAGNASEAEYAYKYMLSKDPNLDRVSLDLALLYLATGKLEESKALFEQVASHNPPKDVKKNIENQIAKINNALKKNIFSVSAALGVNIDSNATSAASTGETTFSNISIPLAESSKADSDEQGFATTSLSHTRKFKVDSQSFGSAFTTSGTLYKTSQSTEHQLDISLASVKMGPTFTFPKLKTKVSLAGTGSIFVLNSFKYMKTRGGELTFTYYPTNRLIFDSATSYDYRKYANSPTVQTNTDRTGNAYQEKLGVTFIATKKDILNASITWRNEEARVDKFGLDQIGLTSSYTRFLPYDMTFNIMAAYKESHYNDLDTSISTIYLRQDREKTYTVSLAKKLPENVTVTSSYQYKDSDSNIQNYTFINNKFSLSFAWSY